MSKEIELTLYSKPNCPLCDEMVAALPRAWATWQTMHGAFTFGWWAVMP